MLVIGGGLFGACAAWDAAQRGLSVALIERGDFGGATSANSFKIVHGGIRYLQHGDVYRLRQSSNERRVWLRIAPHLVRPLPIVIPTFGRGSSGKAALRAGIRIYDALTLDRNRGLSDPARQLPRGRILSARRIRELFPGLVRPDATGGGVFCDAQFYNPPRLVWAVVQSAAGAGAIAANHVEATRLLRRGDRAEGVVARDLLGNDELAIRAGMVVNAAGPYAEALLARWGLPLPTPASYSRDACFVVPHRLLPGTNALALLGQTRDPDARLSRGARHLFIVPWRDYTLVGVWHRVQQSGSLDVAVTDDELARFVAEIKGSAPALDLTPYDVSAIHSGLVPFGENPEGAEDLRYGHRSTLVDHARVHRCENLISLIGIRLTTARLEAERCIDLVFRKRGQRPPASSTSITPVQGGDIPNWEDLVRRAEGDIAGRIPTNVAHSLVSHYGSEYDAVLAEPGRDPMRPIAGSATIRAQVYRAVRAEMAMTLGDVVLRRTDLASGAYPGTTALAECGGIAAAELGWTRDELERQIAGVAKLFPTWERERAEAKAQTENGGRGVGSSLPSHMRGRVASDGNVDQALI